MNKEKKPPLEAQSGIAKNSAIVFAGTMVANVASYAYHLLMGRMLGPSGYGELSSLLSIFYVFTVPIIVGQTVLVKLVSTIKATGSVGQARTLFVKITRYVIAGSAVVLPIIIAASGSVVSYLHLSTESMFTSVYVLFVISLLAFIAASMLQGYQKFIPYSILAALAVVIKVLLSLPAVPYGVYGVLWASILAAGIGYILYIPSIRFLFLASPEPTRIKKSDAIRFAVPAFLTILGITSLYSTDVILVRHYFSSVEAGVYSALAILGKIIFYASSAITLALFPVVSERTAKHEPVGKLIRLGVGGVAGISVILAGLYSLFPAVIIRMLFGNSYAGSEHLLGQFGVFLGVFSIGFIVSNMCLAIGATRIWIFPVVSAVLQIAAITRFHSSLSDVIMVNIAVCIVYVAGAGMYLVSKRI